MASELPPYPFEDLSGSPPPMAGSHQRTWSQLRQAVKKTRRLATSVLNRVPHSFTFRHVETDQGTQTRLYFLGVPQGNRENTILYVDLSPELRTEWDLLTWRCLLDSFHATPMHGQFSKEEQLLRERKRLGSFGITSYDYLEERGRFAFPACNSLFLCTDSLAQADGSLVGQAAFPTEAKSACIGTRLDPKICPNNSELLAFISANDIWVTNLASGHEQRLTYSHKGGCSLAEDPISAGVPSFVVQEEFDRYTGYWWQPQISTVPGAPDVYRLLFEEVDESEVEILHIVSPTNDEKGVDEYRYPRAGTPNARCKLKIVEFQLDTMGAIVNVVEKQMSESLNALFPSMEYIPRVGWVPDGQSIYAELLDRQQLHQQLVLIPLSTFVSCSVDDTEMMSLEMPLTYPVQVIFEETSDIWMNVHDILHFLPHQNPEELSFIWSSEKTGFRHLYFITVKITNPLLLGLKDVDMENTPTDTTKAPLIREIPLTSGEWEVSAKQVWVDEEKKLVYFMGLKDTPMETHLYVVSYENPDAVVRLTQLGYCHTVEMDKACSMFVTVYSSISQPPASAIYRIMFTDDGNILPQIAGALLQSATASEDYHAPELFNFKSEYGHMMYGMFYKPHDLEVGRQYPTVMVVYGGPQVQLVTNAYKGHRFLRLHTLAMLGYAVVVVDSRGSAHRGLQFESHIKHRLGTVEIEDQVEGLHWLASQVDFIDLSRVAIHGWSYGGYLSLMGLAQRPDVFKVAVAGAPVTSWNLYDTGYTERYMDTPQNNLHRYKQGSVLEYVEKFPSEGNRLLIVHGLIDENVHFSHTSLLINALIKACKPYQLQVYPNERHGIRNPDASEHYETMVLNFLQQNL